MTEFSPGTSPPPLRIPMRCVPGIPSLRAGAMLREAVTRSAAGQAVLRLVCGRVPPRSGPMAAGGDDVRRDDLGEEVGAERRHLEVVVLVSGAESAERQQ